MHLKSSMDPQIWRCLIFLIAAEINFRFVAALPKSGSPRGGIGGGLLQPLKLSIDRWLARITDVIFQRLCWFMIIIIDVIFNQNLNYNNDWLANRGAWNDRYDNRSMIWYTKPAPLLMMNVEWFHFIIIKKKDFIGCPLFWMGNVEFSRGNI